MVDTTLRQERIHADVALEGRLESDEARTDAAVDGTRAKVNEKIAEAEQVGREVAADAVESEAPRNPAKAREHVEQAVEHVAEQAKAGVEAERAQTDDLHAAERDAAKRAFLDILAKERLDTDTAIVQERDVADRLVDSRDEALAMISHDLRNLLQAIQWKAQLLCRNVPPEVEFPRRLADEIATSCVIMARWATDLVDLSSLDAGTFHLERDAHRARELAERAAQIHLAKAVAKGITLSVEAAEDTLSVDCDGDRIVQVLTNLVDNATKFTPRNGEVTARVAREGTNATFSVSDTGPGLTREDQHHVFERRWHTNRRGGGGAGLGLYICKRIVEAHGGAIWVDSRPGHGATFSFSLPITGS